MAKKFTDNLLARLHLGLEDDINKLQQEGKNPQEIYAYLLSRVNASLTQPDSVFFGFDADEQKNVYEVLNTVFLAHPYSRRVNKVEREKLLVFKLVTDDSRLNYHYHPHCYCPTNDALFTWIMLSSLTNHSHYYGHGGSFNHHGHSSATNSDDCGKLIALLLCIALAAFAVVLTTIALYYLLNQTLNNLERFCYNEGWLQATVTLASTIASGCAAGMLAATFASAPLAALAIAAGLSNPVGLAIFGVICLTIMGAGLGCFITHQIQNYAIKKANPAALDPQDPHRFTLTDAEEENLRSKNIDPLRVKCAMVAIRAEMGEKPVPSLLNRIFTSKGEEKQELLHKIRQLRQGELQQVEVGGKIFDLTPFIYPPLPVVYMQPYSPSTRYHGHATTVPVYPNGIVDNGVPPPPYPTAPLEQMNYMGYPSLI